MLLSPFTFKFFAIVPKVLFMHLKLTDLDIVEQAVSKVKCLLYGFPFYFEDD